MRASDLLAGAEKMFTKVLAERIFAFEDQAAHAFARIASNRRKAGRPISEMDAQIAAIASVHDAVLATRNTADFEGCGIRLGEPLARLTLRSCFNSSVACTLLGSRSFAWRLLCALARSLSFRFCHFSPLLHYSSLSWLRPQPLKPNIPSPLKT